MRAAVIQGQDVVNVIVADHLGTADELKAAGLIPEDSTLVPTDTAGPGWTYVDGQFVAPPEPPQPPAPGMEGAS